MPSYTVNVELTSVPPGSVLTTAGAAVVNVSVDPVTNTAITAAVVAANMTNFVAQGQTMLDLAKQAGVDNTGAVECAAAVQTALNSAAALGVRVFARGTIKTASTLTIKGSVDLADLTVNYTGTGIAVQVGDTSVTSTNNKVYRLPQVVNLNKSGTGWTSVAGSVGVRVSNLFGCEVHVPHVLNFETGLVGHGQSGGCGYNTFFIGILENNKVNFQAAPDTTGWFNQNTFIGGRYQHHATELTAVAGTRHVQILTATSTITNLVWYNASLETPINVEYMIDCNGQYNTWDMCRFEVNTNPGTPNVKWGPGAKNNLIRYGYAAELIVETFDAAAHANTVLTYGTSKTRAVSTVSVTTVENGNSDATPVETIMPALSYLSGADPTTAYCAARSAQMSKFKRTGDAGDRIQLDHQNGRLYLGVGTGAPTFFLGADGSGLTINGGPLRVDTDASRDLGATTLRFRNVWVGGGLSSGTRTVTATTTLTNTDGTVFANNAGAATLTLPSASTVPGRIIRIRSIAAGAVTVASAGGTVDVTSIAAGGKVTYQSDATNWWSVA